jgi:D-alanine-D-alanine ligase-like ATP-grasp enzyme
MKSKRIAVVMGGPSAEYEVSILSGIEAVTHIATLPTYTVRAVVITGKRNFTLLI